jgi:hypothetical protein
MKNKYSPESQEFGEDCHDSLVAFLKQNKPIVPPPAPNFEQQLFAEIRKSPRSPSRLTPWLLLVIPIAIASGLGFNWATNRSTYQVANISETDQAEIEQLLISSWNINDDSVDQSVANPSEAQFLNELAPIEYE